MDHQSYDELVLKDMVFFLELCTNEGWKRIEFEATLRTRSFTAR